MTQFGSAQEAIGKTLAISSVPFVIIGVFRERVATFGQSEIVDETVLIPYTVARYFTGTDAVNQIYFSMTDSGSVPWATQAIKAASRAGIAPNPCTTWAISQRCCPWQGRRPQRSALSCSCFPW